ncbi:Isochorismatase hydrolase [Mycena floridula]|nr:Isochorismatase hydrolase [Mycena floridula]
MDLEPANSLFLVCDIQTKFKNAIHGYEHVVNSTNKMLRIAKTFDIPVVVTTQYAKALGPTDPDLDLASPLQLCGPFDKTLFSMLIPEVNQILISRPNVKNIVLMGIETHICILQTALSLMRQGYTPYILADATSSSSSSEAALAHALLRQAGAIITSSESLCFLLVKDASRDGFKAMSNIIKEEKPRTTAAVQSLMGFASKSAL